MQQVFTEHYIEVPEEKYDVLSEMQTKIDALQTKLDEQVNKNLELNEEAVYLKKQNIFSEIAEDMADTEAEKFAVMVDDITYTSADSYRSKLQVVKENYFRKETSQSSETLEDTVDEISLTENTVMSRYAQALSKGKKF
jgi:ABC-type glutathione transport system ATPase component